MFEQCSLQVAKATMETLARRPEAVEGSATTNQELATTTPESGQPGMPAASPGPVEGVPPTQSCGVNSWSEEQLVTWLRDVMKLDSVAQAVINERGVDGATALELDSNGWKELGASAVKAAKI